MTPTSSTSCSTGFSIALASHPLSVGYVASNNDGVTTLSWIEDFWDPTVQYLKLSQRSWKICVAGDHRCDGLAMAGYSLQPCSVDLTDSGILLFLEISCLCDVVEKNKEQQQRDPRKEKTHIYWHVCVSLPSYSYSGSRGSGYSAFRLLKPNWVVSLVVAGKG